MSAENTQNPALIAVLGILGILAIALAAGLFLMQKQDADGPINFSTALSSREAPIPTEEFDPISWAREGAAYPPLEEAEALQGDFVADYTGTGALPVDDADIPEPVVSQQPVSAAPLRRPRWMNRRPRPSGKSGKTLIGCRCSHPGTWPGPRAFAMS
jgi:hypothetical protein